MIDTLEFYEELKEIFGQEAAKKLANILGRVYRELSNAVTKAEFEKLINVVSELAEVQKRTEERVNELVQAQRKTEDEISKLTKALNNTRQQLGGLSDTVGYTLENEAFKALPYLLKRDYNITVEGKLKRGYLMDIKGNYIEVNIMGVAQRNGKKVMIIGEGKVRLSRKAVNEFIEKRVKKLSSIYDELFPVLVTHMITQPDVEEYANKKGIAVYYSYDF